jgi:EEF1A lysine methyltransferase 1
LLEGADASTRIVIISAPSVYAALKKRDPNNCATKELYLLEFDDRFKILAGNKFFHYDFARPLDLPKELAGTFDRILIDPPFLSDDCQTKAALTARWLTRKDKTSLSKSGTLQYRTIVCTGERMCSLIEKVYPDTTVTDFFPEHSKGLSNEFRCYASYQGVNWKFSH